MIISKYFFSTNIVAMCTELIVVILVIFVMLYLRDREGMFSRPIHYQNWDNFAIANPFDDRTNPDFQYRYGLVWPGIYV